jgi:phosphoribosylanthranilate isomerase
MDRHYPRTRIKICGITRIEDALAAAELGVDAIGLVFYPNSSRLVDTATAANIVAVLPPFVASVGLFLDPTALAVRAVLEQVPLDFLQFHGNETPEFCQSFGQSFIKAVPMRVASDVSAYARAFASAKALLLDSHGDGVIGGTGERFDWRLIPRQLAKPIILAGGLNPANVAAAVREVRPYAVDVSSGVEAAKGIKDRRLLQEFIYNLQGVTDDLPK